ncbi:hypothetical protein BSQ39_08650 [Loigolactobacillus backii]|uniref:hypothetical protein n=1 Tax=Loigolactobacillus backii TaxID=375175 RepID=UPI000C1CA226|nr:hypothetical protein [Loigolactobacillus backii]PIO83628.1 hypothetical protein BSQ39_08650 [Loigolactobacillus backii]
MGEQIPFPKNFDRFIMLGKAAAKKEDWKVAADNFSAAYQTKQDFNTNLLLATALMESGQYLVARQVAGEYENDYQASLSLISFYISLLLTAHDFVKATQICDQHLAKAKAADIHFWTETQKHIKGAENKYRHEEAAHLKELQKALYNLSDRSIYEQMDLLKQANQLPKEEFTVTAKWLLRNPFVHPLLKANVLADLQKMRVSDEVSLLWLDNKEYQVIPERLLPIMEYKSIITLKQLLAEKVGNDDPIVYQNLTEEINLHAAYLYPFADKVVKDPTLWLAVYLDFYTTDKLNKKQIDSENLTQIQQWQEKLRETTNILTL